MHSETTTPPHFIGGHTIVQHDGEAVRQSKDRYEVGTSIWITFEKIGLHRYPNAPEEVAYLRNEHRHIFKFKVGITVWHDDREIEFHMMKNRLQALYDGGILQLNHKSCEMLAHELIAQIRGIYDCSQRDISVEVSEDGECGAVVTHTAIR